MFEIENRDQRILVRPFNQAASECVESLDCTADDLKDLVLVHKFVIICVHSCRLVLSSSISNLVARLRGRECIDAG